MDPRDRPGEPGWATSPMQIATGRWSECVQTGDNVSLVGQYVSDMVFDGLHIWVTNSDGNSITKLTGSDGAMVGT
jgi:hypothetical protein